MVEKTTLSAKPDRLPLHIEVSEMLAREIKAGVLIEGEKLEPERAMARRLGIAVGTLRKALFDLSEKGLIERVQGSGNYVRNVDESSTIYGFFRLERLTGGGLPTASTLAVDKIAITDSDPDVEALDFSQLNQYYRFRRLRFLNEMGVALEEIWLDASYVKTALTTSTVGDSLYQFYKESLDFWIARVEDSVSVSTPPEWRPDEFCSNAAQHWGFVERRSWDHLGQQAEYSKTWFDTDVARYIARWK